MRKLAVTILSILALAACSSEATPSSAEFDIDPRLEQEVGDGAEPDGVLFVEPGAEEALLEFAQNEGYDIELYPEFGLASLFEIRDIAVIEEMISNGWVRRADADAYFRRTTSTAALDLIHQPAAIATGNVGSGSTVAVLDSGLDYTHSDFGSCTSSASASGTPQGIDCRVRASRDFAPDDGTLDDSGRHGTNVAAVIATIAPDVELVGLDVFDGDVARSTDLIAALSWVVQNASVHDIRVVNLSLGGSTGYTGTCDSTSLAVAIRGVTNAGISVVAAAGNDGFKGSMSSPACVSEALSVGAVYPAQRGRVVYSMCQDDSPVADLVACFSNASPELDLVAPGVAIPGGGVVMSGTSQATPHVAAAAAILHSADRTASPARVRQALMTSPTSVTDPGNSTGYPRLDIEAALTNLIGAPAPTPAPTPAPAPAPAPAPEPAPAPAPEPCTPSMTIELRTSTIAPEGAVFDVTIDAAADCSWVLSSDAGWLFPVDPAGTGSETREIVVLENIDDARSASLVVGTESQEIRQESGGSPDNFVIIDGGMPRTGSTTVTIDITTVLADRASAVCVSSTTSCTEWQPYSHRITTELPAVPGDQTVNVWVLRPNGIMAAILVSDTIELAF